MDIRSLHYFTVVAEELNITRAAGKLHMSQPPLSAQIKSLERELDTELFIRGGRQLMLTESGQLLYRRAKEILSLTDKTKAEVLSMGKGMRGTISIGLVEGMAPYIAADWFAGFLAKYPNLKFRITDGSSDVLVEKMRSGLISLAVITAPCDNSLLHSFHVGEERLVALMSKSHPLAHNGKDEINISDLVGENLIVPGRAVLIEAIYNAFKEIGEEPKIVCEMDSYLDAVALAEKKMGISLFPITSFVQNDSVIAKETASRRTLEYLFVWRKSHPLPTIEERFIDYVRSMTSTEGNSDEKDT